MIARQRYLGMKKQERKKEKGQDRVKKTTTTAKTQSFEKRRLFNQAILSFFLLARKRGAGPNIRYLQDIDPEPAHDKREEKLVFIVWFAATSRRLL